MNNQVPNTDPICLCGFVYPLNQQGQWTEDEYRRVAAHQQSHSPLPNTDPSLSGCPRCDHPMDRHTGHCHHIDSCEGRECGCTYRLPAAVSEVDGGTQTERSDRELLYDILFYSRSRSDNHAKFDAVMREACIKVNGFDPDVSVAPQGTVEGETPKSQFMICIWCAWECEKQEKREDVWAIMREHLMHCDKAPYSRMSKALLAAMRQAEVLKTKLAESVAPPSVAMPLTGARYKGTRNLSVPFTAHCVSVSHPNGEWDSIYTHTKEQAEAIVSLAALPVAVSGEGSGVPALDEKLHPLIALWDKAVGTPGYEKGEWIRFHQQVWAALSSPLQEGAIGQMVTEYRQTAQGFKDGTIGGMESMALLNLSSALGEYIIRSWPPDTKGGTR